MCNCIFSPRLPQPFVPRPPGPLFARLSASSPSLYTVQTALKLAGNGKHSLLAIGRRLLRERAFRVNVESQIKLHQCHVRVKLLQLARCPILATFQRSTKQQTTKEGAAAKAVERHSLRHTFKPTKQNNEQKLTQKRHQNSLRPITSGSCCCCCVCGFLHCF